MTASVAWVDEHRNKLFRVFRKRKRNKHGSFGHKLKSFAFSQTAIFSLHMHLAGDAIYGSQNPVAPEKRSVMRAKGDYDKGGLHQNIDFVHNGHMRRVRCL